MIAAARAWIWLPLSLLVGAVGGLVLSRWHVDSAWFTVLIGLPLVFILCWRDMARRDPVRFLSVAVPAWLLALVGVISPGPTIDWISLMPYLFVGAFVFFPKQTWPFWRHNVLRRTPSHALRFDQALYMHSQAIRRLLDGPDDAFDDASVGAARAEIERLRGATAPSPDWATVRDQLVDLEEEWIELRLQSAPLDEYTPLQVRWTAIAAGLEALRSADGRGATG